MENHLQSGHHHSTTTNEVTERDDLLEMRMQFGGFVDKILILGNTSLKETKRRVRLVF